MLLHIRNRQYFLKVWYRSKQSPILMTLSVSEGDLSVDEPLRTAHAFSGLTLKHVPTPAPRCGEGVHVNRRGEEGIAAPIHSGMGKRRYKRKKANSTSSVDQPLSCGPGCIFQTIFPVYLTIKHSIYVYLYYYFYL